MKNLCKLSICFFLSLMVLSSCNSTPENLPKVNEETPAAISSPIETLNDDERSETVMFPQIEFGYANIDGSKLIVLYDHEVDDNKLFTYFEYAVGENGNVFQIEYDTYQERGQNDNGRQTMRNFDNQSGCIYNVVNAVADSEETYLLLTKEEYENIRVLQKVGNAEMSVASEELLAQCTKLAGRKAKNGWNLTEYQNGIKISMVEFESIGKDLLAWMVLEDGETLRYCEFPATLSDDEYTGWRLGDCGNLDVQNFYVLSTVQNSQGTVVYIGWYDEEGESVEAVEFFADENPNTKSVCGRYTYPI